LLQNGHLGSRAVAVHKKLSPISNCAKIDDTPLSQLFLLDLLSSLS
jgi:hypothetical protein